ncbi:MAG: hypothetical protein MUE81_06830 [Thermoflexibacter sp.]|jgi:hypothetical protein|nr:hypothetical protein [Thermoflexibacter sp.]
MKDFKILFKRRKEANQERASDIPSFVKIFAQSFIIARAFGMREVREEHLLLALIKYAPESLAVRYQY